MVQPAQYPLLILPARIEELVREAEGWVACRNLRLYVGAVREALGEAAAREPAAGWLAFAEECAARQDPLPPRVAALRES